MKRVALALSATCLAVVAIVATRAILSDSGGAESAGRVPSAATLGTAAVTDPEVDADMRAWDRALAAAGPDDAVGLSRTVDGVRLSFKVPTSDSNWTPGPIEAVPGVSSASPAAAHWRSGSLYISKDVGGGSQDAEAVVFWTSFPDGDHADPCAKVLSRPIGPSAAELAGAVATAPGTELVMGPSDVSVGGHAAKHMVLTVREDVGCDPGYFYTWDDVWKVGPYWGWTNVGDTIRVWIIDVNGTRLFIEAETTPQARTYLENFARPPLTIEQEIQRIVESIRFDY